eukprot:Seg1338.4 transcript_id=Seg1338.4/GoldUCD/mRNA.D3Y31 product="hypothetical protein" protein_id=Seg1338.4/GoldUCD/D3Y31
MNMTDLTLRSNLLESPEGNDNRTSTRNGLIRRCLGKFGRKWQFAFQVFHFLISMCYLWAGVVEFIRNPPYFDAYGDADSHIDLPPKLFENDKRMVESGLVRFIDFPILLILIAYKAVCIWLKYKGLSWLITICLTMTFFCFWIVNFWARKLFDWRNYSSRMYGLQLQVSLIALSGTMVCMVIFYTRRKLPFKFKSSLKIKQNSKVHVIWNFVAIYLVLFSSLMVWFIKMYASWACFKSASEIMQLCSTTNQVQCYACPTCNSASLEKCVEKVKNRRHVFSCSQSFPDAVNQGSFCIFNFNMGIVGFLLTFAYIGGLCVFMSTFLRIFGHYTVRGLILIYTKVIQLHCCSREVINSRHGSLDERLKNNGAELQDATESRHYNYPTSEPSYCSESEDEAGNRLLKYSVQHPKVYCEKYHPYNATNSSQAKKLSFAYLVTKTQYSKPTANNSPFTDEEHEPSFCNSPLVADSKTFIQPEHQQSEAIDASCIDAKAYPSQFFSWKGFVISMTFDDDGDSRYQDEWK